MCGKQMPHLFGLHQCRKGNCWKCGPHHKVCGKQMPHLFGLHQCRKGNCWKCGPHHKVFLATSPWLQWACRYTNLGMLVCAGITMFCSLALMRWCPICPAQLLHQSFLLPCSIHHELVRVFWVQLAFRLLGLLLSKRLRMPDRHIKVAHWLCRMRRSWKCAKQGLQPAEPLGLVPCCHQLH
jgi:hypothetical protein